MNAARSALPLYLTVGIGAFVLFAGNGLDAKLVTGRALELPTLRLLLLAVWVLASLPAARALLATPETFFLRVLPVPRSLLLLLFGLGLCVAHFPWFLLWQRGAGTSMALTASFTAMALQSALVARRCDASLGAAVALVAWGVWPTGLAAPLPLAAFVLAHARVWARAAEPAAAGKHAVCSVNRPLALASVLAVAVYRGHSSVLIRGLLLAALSCLGVVLSLRNNAVTDATAIARVSLLAWGPACLFGAASIAGPVLRVEAGSRWLLDVCGTPPLIRSGAAAGLLAAVGATAGAVYAALAAASLELPNAMSVTLAAELAASGAAWAAIAMSVVRLTLRGTGHDSARLILALGLVYLASVALVLLHAAASAVLLLGSAVALAALVLRLEQRVRPMSDEAAC